MPSFMEDIMAQAQHAATAQAQHAAAAQAQQAQHSPLEQRRMGAAEKLEAEYQDLLKNRPRTSYGALAQSQIQKKREARKPPPQNATLKFSLLPAAESESFSPEELYALATDSGFVRKTLLKYTGKEPSEQQILDLQRRITDKFPQLATGSKLENRPISISDVKKRMMNGIFQAYEGGNFKPAVDFILEYPEIFPQAVAGANKLKSQGYTIGPDYDADIGYVKSFVNTYAKHPLGKQELFRRVETNEGFGQGQEGQEVTNAVLKRIQEQNKQNNFRSSELRNPASKAEIERNLLSRMQESKNVEEEVERLRDTSKRIAPLTESHEESKQLLKRGLTSPTLATVRSKLSDAERMNIPGEIAPYLEAANKPMREYVRQFMVDYRPIIKGYREEAAKDFLEHDIPKINSEFAHKGAFFSGAREAAINKARADKEARIERETQKLLVHGHEQARKHFHSHREGTLKSAEIAGNARRSQIEAMHHQAGALQSNAQAEQAANLANASALSNVGRIEQQQAQNELNVRMAEHREQQERPYIDLAARAALMNQQQLPPLHYPDPTILNPQPPQSLYGLGANLLGLAAGQNKMGYAKEAPFKKGGHVMKRYANGGPIAKHAGEWNQFEKHMEGTPSARVADESMREAQALRNHRVDPQGAYLMMLTGHQMANPGKPMMQTFGEGTLKGYEAFNSAKNYNVESKKRYINLINAINASRMEGQGLLANYHLKRSDQDETQRYHNMSHAENVRAHNMMYERKTQQPLKRSATEINLEAEAKQKLLQSSKMKEEINHLRKLIKNTNTGPRWGFFKSNFLPTTETDNDIRVLTNNIIMDMHQGMKNIPRSEGFMERLESTKPTIRNHYSSNKLSINIMDKGANNINKHATTTLLSLGWTPEKIHEFLEEEKSKVLEEEKQGESDTSLQNATNDNDEKWVWMQFPGESKQTEVAKEDVEKAQARGAKIV